MKDIILQIDGKEVKSKEGMTILEAAESVGIFIPKLCYHEKMIPFGGCRLCIVDVESGGWNKLVVSCVYPVEQNLIVKTKTEKVNRIRKTILELLLAHAPNSLQIKTLAQEYGADKNRFEKEASFCVHCGLCVRYCNEVKKLNAVGFVDRGPDKEISFVPEIAARECKGCMECFPLCPTSYLQAAFVLTEAFAFSKESLSQKESSSLV